MKSLRTTILILLVFVPGLVSAQETPRVQLFGVVKAKYETSLYDGDQRFNVRNTRLGVKGSIIPQMNFQMQMELNSQGAFDVLDTYVTYDFGMTRAGSFEVLLGQQPNRFSTEFNRGAGGGVFANRSFMGKFMGRYYDGTAIGDVGSRDIGAMLHYVAPTELPITVYAGIFNGAGINNPRWTNSVNFSGTVAVGGSVGLRGAVNYYAGKTISGHHVNMWGIEGRYATGGFVFEAEYGMRNLDLGADDDQMSIGLAQAWYSFPLRSNKFARTIVPLLRWDIGDNIRYNLAENFDAQRITAGVTIGLTDKLLRSEIRFNVEHYMQEDKPADIGTNRLLQDKFTVEFFLTF